MAPARTWPFAHACCKSPDVMHQGFDLQIDGNARMGKEKNGFPMCTHFYGRIFTGHISRTASDLVLTLGVPPLHRVLMDMVSAGLEPLGEAKFHNTPQLRDCPLVVEYSNKPKSLSTLSPSAIPDQKCLPNSTHTQCPIQRILYNCNPTLRGAENVVVIPCFCNARGATSSD